MILPWPLRVVVEWLGMLREVYSTLDGTDPTYHPQRAEDRLAEVRKFASNNPGPAEAEEPASREQGRGNKEGSSLDAGEE